MAGDGDEEVLDLGEPAEGCGTGGWGKGPPARYRRAVPVPPVTLATHTRREAVPQTGRVMDPAKVKDGRTGRPVPPLDPVEVSRGRRIAALDDPPRLTRKVTDSDGSASAPLKWYEA